MRDRLLRERCPSPSRWACDLGQDLADGVPRQSQIAGDLPDRGTGLPTSDDLIALLLVHKDAALR